MDEVAMLRLILLGFAIIAAAAEGNSHSRRYWNNHNHNHHSPAGGSGGSSQQAGKKKAWNFFDALPTGRRPGQTLPKETVEFVFAHQSCHAKDIYQNVTAAEPGCETKTIRNRMCYGVCAGIHVPGGVPGADHVTLCTTCQPAGRKTPVEVTLKCGMAEEKTITVQTVERCACGTCVNGRI